MKIKDLSPDLILLNGRIYTMAGENTVAQAVAIKDGRFLASGSDAEIAGLAEPGTQRIDLRGKTAIPGLFDAHVHVMEVGIKLSQIRLDECRSPEEMAELVRERAKVTPPGTWIVGQGWNEGNFKDGRLPTRRDLDPATDKHPVLLQRFFNTDVVNTVGLRLAGIDRNTPDPANGRIERDENGEPNGLLRARAKALARGLVPKPTVDEMQSAIKLGCEELNRYGITSAIEPGLNADEMRAYAALRQAQGLALPRALSLSKRPALAQPRGPALRLRVNVMPSWHGFREDETEAQLDARARELGIRSGLGDEVLRVGALKMAIDGGTTPHTAYMYEPFEGDDRLVAFNRLDVEDLYRYFCTAQELGWDVGIHCCGDHAQDLAVDTFARVAAHGPRPDARHSIIHGYFPTEHALQQMAANHIAAVIQPTFIYWEGELLFRDVGHSRAANYKPARKYLDHGVPLAASSDVPSTVSPNPFIALYSLVTRKNRFGQEIAPQEAIGRREALAAYTTGGTWLTREEGLKGTIEPGKLADLCVLDRDYFRVPDEEIKDIDVELTVLGGEVVWEGRA